MPFRIYIQIFFFSVCLFLTTSCFKIEPEFDFAKSPSLNPLAQIEISGNLDFGNVAIGGIATTVITLSNVGLSDATAITFPSLSLPLSYTSVGSPEAPGHCSGAGLASGDSCQIEVEFTPTTGGPLNFNFSVNYHDSEALQNVLASLTGQASSPATLNFSYDNSNWQNVTYKSQARVTVTVTNGGGVSAIINAINIPNSAFYIASNGTCSLGTVIPPGNHCTVNIDFKSPGLKTGAISLITGALNLSFYDGANTQTPTFVLSGTGIPQPINVDPFYVSAPNWNDYIENPSGLVSNTFSLADKACSAAAPKSPYGCIHGGELRKIVLGNELCSDLTLTETLTFFNWKCDDTGPGTYFYSTGVKKGIGLRDLVTATGFKNNDILITSLSGFEIYKSPPTFWWSNSFRNINSDIISQDLKLSNTGEIAVVSTSINSEYDTYIDADKVAFVTLPGTQVSYTGTSSGTCNENDGTNVLGSTNRCLLSVGSNGTSLRSHAWIEADIVQGNAKYGISAARTRFSRFQFSKIIRGPTGSLNRGGLRIFESHSNIISDIKIHSINSHGLHIVNSSDNLIQNIRTANNSGYGLWLYFNSSGRTTERNIVKGISTYSNQSHGIYLNNVDHNILTEILSSHNNSMGIKFDFSNNNILNHITTPSNAMSGLYLSSSGNNSFWQTLSSKNNLSGILLTGSASNNNRFEQIVSMNNDDGISIVSLSHTNSFSKNLLVASNLTSACTVTTTGTDPGLLDSTCKNSSGSDAILLTTGDLSSTFVGSVISDDSVNVSDTNGSASWSFLLDWLSFENPFRTWGTLSGSTGNCVSGGNCNMWDWRFRSIDTLLKGRSNDLASGAETFTPLSSCPMAVHGNKEIFVNNGLINSHILVNAVEKMGDFIGNDNGLCETNETCIYSPNYGAYQGEGGLHSTSCAFTDGTNVTGVTIQGRVSDSGP